MSDVEMVLVLLVAFIGISLAVWIARLHDRRVMLLEKHLNEMHQQTLKLHNNLQPNFDTLSSLTARMDRVVIRLQSVVPKDLRRHIREVIQVHTEVVVRRDAAELKRLHKLTNDLEDWLAAFASGRESMQAVARKGLPAGLRPQTEGRVFSHMERMQISVKPRRPGGSDSGPGDAPGDVARSRGERAER